MLVNPDPRLNIDFMNFCKNMVSMTLSSTIIRAFSKQSRLLLLELFSFF